MSDLTKRLREDCWWAYEEQRGLFDEAADEIERLTTKCNQLHRRLAEIIGLCSQEGCDGEPYDTIAAIAIGEFTTRGGGS